MSDHSPILHLANVTRTFPGVLALESVSLDLQAGEVHAVVGENGAGKSTLINIVCGVLQPDDGQIRLEGAAVRFFNPVAARHHGIVAVHQEADFFPTLSVAENMALPHGLPTGRFGFVDWATIYGSAARYVEEMREYIDVRRPAAHLSVAHRQMTQVASALLRGAKVVILDEPTSALTEQESKWLFEQVRTLRKNGVGIIYISHRHEEVFELSDRITVLRDGRKIWTRLRSAVDRPALIEAMVGRAVSQQGRRSLTPTPQSKPRLEVCGLTHQAGRFAGVNLDVHAGEIVGLYGLVGAGRTELAQAIFGLLKPSAGTIRVDGQVLARLGPRRAMRAGIAYVPEDRLSEGICPGLSVRANTVIAFLARLAHGSASRAGSLGNGGLRRALFGWLASRRAESNAAGEVTTRLKVRHRSLEQPIRQLSGGNQQKVVLGRWLLADPKVLILDEPTRGVDVGAKAEIHGLLRDIADQGGAILMISSELPEILAHSDRVVVLCQGRIAGKFDPRCSSPEQIATAALPVEPSSGGPAVSPRRWPWLQSFPCSEFALATAVLVLSMWLGVTSEGFFEMANLSRLLADTALWAILGLAAATVIICGGIDISIGSLLALAAACAGLVLKLPLDPGITIPMAIVAALVVGCLGSLVNGLVSLIGRVHPIVVTLGMMIIYRGMVIALLSGNQINDLPAQFGWLTIPPGSGFRGAIVVGAAVVAVMVVILRYRTIGRHLYALGASAGAARLAGISQTRTWLAGFAVAGLLIGIAAILELSASMQMQAPLARGWELRAIAVAVIGGVSITGGRGTITGVVLGAMLLRLVSSALVRWEIKGDRADAVVGGMILAAVLVDLAWRRVQR